MADNKLNEIISTSLDNIRAIADADTVIGKPIETASGTAIVPVSKVSLGFASGGADYVPGEKKKEADSASDKAAAAKTNGNGKSPCFAGGGGTGVTITPVCFLVIKANGDVDLLTIPSANVSSSPAVGIVDSVSSFIEKSPDLITRFKEVFAKNKNQTELDDEKLKEQIADDASKE